MKTLETTFTSSGFVHEQIVRDGNLAIYRRFKQVGGKEHFEVVRIRSHSGFKIPGTEKMAEPAEMYPSGEQWGLNGWTYPDRESAETKFQELATAVSAVRLPETPQNERQDANGEQERANP